MERGKYRSLGQDGRGGESRRVIERFGFERLEMKEMERGGVLRRSRHWTTPLTYIEIGVWILETKVQWDRGYFGNCEKTTKWLYSLILLMMIMSVKW